MRAIPMIYDIPEILYKAVWFTSHERVKLYTRCEMCFNKLNYGSHDLALELLMDLDGDGATMSYEMANIYTDALVDVLAGHGVQVLPDVSIHNLYRMVSGLISLSDGHELLNGIPPDMPENDPEASLAYLLAEVGKMTRLDGHMSIAGVDGNLIKRILDINVREDEVDPDDIPDTRHIVSRLKEFDSRNGGKYPVVRGFIKDYRIFPIQPTHALDVLAGKIADTPSPVTASLEVAAILLASELPSADLKQEYYVRVSDNFEGTLMLNMLREVDNALIGYGNEKT